MLNNKDTDILIPRTCECYLHGKRELIDMIKLRILRWEIILGYPGGLNVITRVLIGAGGSTSEEHRGSRGWSGVLQGWRVEGGGGALGQGKRGPLEAGKDKRTFFPGAFRRNQP